jgi:hypothetical protein
MAHMRQGNAVHTQDLGARDVRYIWVVTAAVVGGDALFVTSALNVVGCAAVVVFCGLAASHSARYRGMGITLVSIGVGLMVPGWPVLLLQGVNSL